MRFCRILLSLLLVTYHLANIASGNWGKDDGWPAPEIQRRSVDSAHSEWQERSRSTIVADGDYHGSLKTWLARLERGMGQVYGWEKNVGKQKIQCPALNEIRNYNRVALREFRSQRSRISRLILPRLGRTPPDTEIASRKICLARTDLALEAHEVWDEKLRQGQAEYLSSHQAFRARQKLALQILDEKREGLSAECLPERETLRNAWALAGESDRNVIETLDTAIYEWGVRYNRLVELLQEECPLPG